LSLDRVQVGAPITTGDVLAGVVESARSTDCVALDTEFLRERTYRARLCLVQLATPTTVHLVDPLVDIDLRPIAELIADPSIEVIVHAGRQDFELFVERYGVTPTRIFDVQLAAGFVGLGASLPYGRLVEETAGVQLVKGESYTDWCRRPLTNAQLSYAADDVRYLFAATDHIKERLNYLGRTSWVEEEMRMFEDPTMYATDPSDAWRRVSGRGGLSGRQLAVLREAAMWREEAAARRDIPRGWVIKDPTLVELARKAPTSVGGLKNIRGMNAREAERSGRDVVDAIRRGLDSPPVKLPPSPPRAALARSRMLSGLADAIVRARCEHHQIAPELVATRGELEALLVDAFKHDPSPAQHRLLQGWRRELAGDAVLALAWGRLAVRVIEDPPYVEEVPLEADDG
jgi:ribonuclease D